MWIKNVIIGSPLEGVARKACSLFRTGPGKVNEQNSLYDEQTRAILERSLSPNSNCIDVGCHRGTILDHMLQYAPEGTHYAFEPIPALYEGLVASYPGVRVLDVALSDIEGELTFQYVVTNPGYSGLRRRRYERKDELVKEIKVKSNLLDNVVPEGLSVALIKIDVEGAELQVLKGAVHTIRRNKPVIIFEHGIGAADCYGTSPEDVYNLLTSECGLKVSLMENWLNDGGPLSDKEFCDQFYQSRNYYFIAHPE